VDDDASLDTLYESAVLTLTNSVKSGRFQEVLHEVSLKEGSNITAAATVDSEQVVGVSGPKIVPPDGVEEVGCGGVVCYGGVMVICCFLMLLLVLAIALELRCFHFEIALLSL
jgi:hypothetical protein